MTGERSSPPRDEEILPLRGNQEVILKAIGYIHESKHLYIKELNSGDRAYLIATGAAVLFLLKDAYLLEASFYPVAWLVPAAIALFAYLKNVALYRALRELAQYEARRIDTLLLDSMAGWETHVNKNREKSWFRRHTSVALVMQIFWIFTVAGCLGMVGFLFGGGKLTHWKSAAECTSQSCAPAADATNPAP